MAPAALYLASFYGYKHTVTLLLANKADIHNKNKQGYTALSGAAWYGRTEIARQLLDEGAAIDEKNNVGNTPLNLAATDGRTETARLLIERNADVNEANKRGETPLIQAARYGHKEIVRLLLDKGVDDLETRDKKGETAVEAALSYGRTEIAEMIQVLVDEKRAAAAAKAEAARQHASAEEMQRIMKNRMPRVKIGAGPAPQKNIDILTGNKLTYHHHSIKGSKTMAANESFNAFMKAERLTRDLAFAVIDGASVDEVAAVLDRGADIDRKYYGNTILIEAVCRKRFDIAHMLIDRGANLDEGNNAGLTALHIAAINNYTALARHLVEMGAGLDVKEKFGRTALYFAKVHKHPDITRRLSKRRPKPTPDKKLLWRGKRR